MYDIYTKSIRDAFAGEGKEYLIVDGDFVLVHGRTWDIPGVQDPAFVGELKGTELMGQRFQCAIAGWRQLRGLVLENAQPWARAVIAAETEG